MMEASALVLSAVIEAPVAALVVRLMGWPSRGATHVGLAAAVATAATHPQLWSAALWAYGRFPFWPAILTLEALVVIVEGLLIGWMAGLKPWRAMVVSLVANAASVLAGLWIAG
ncbi:MAG: hypothetical protein P4M07_27550 [Xanthobacteraceae bacterium]|nr:hypothetical protein [Xanthobacteraceae bacterium]